MFNSLILDWSGTLVDDTGPTLAATNAVLSAYQKEPMTWEQFRNSFRLPYSEWYQEHLPGVSLQELEGHFRRAFDESDSSVTPLDGAHAFLKWCFENRIRLFVLTSMNADIFRKQLIRFGFENYFEDIYAGVIDKREIISELIRDKSLSLRQTAFVGDMQHDVETARYGGICSIAVLSGYDSLEKLEDSDPTLILSSVRSLHALLRQGQACATVSSLDCIGIKRLAVDCHVGVPDEERAQPQTLYITVDIVPGVSFDALEDRVDNTIDYDAVAKRITGLAGERPRKLIETLADDVAQMILSEFEASQVEVEIEKNILPRTDCVTVTTRRGR